MTIVAPPAAGSQMVGAPVELKVATMPEVYGVEQAALLHATTLMVLGAHERPDHEAWRNSRWSMANVTQPWVRVLAPPTCAWLNSKL